LFNGFWFHSSSSIAYYPFCYQIKYLIIRLFCKEYAFYNEHRHSWIQFVTPSQRHNGLDVEILSKLEVLYQKKRNEHPERWTKEEWNWQPNGELELNPEQHKETA
jgi:putative transposase